MSCRAKYLMTCLLVGVSLTIGGWGYAQEISVLAVGDITVGSGLTPIIDAHDIGLLFSETASLIRSADIAVTTLDTSISDRGEPQPGVEHPFRAVPALARGLANAGFKAVSLATPHIMDFGVEGLEDTIRLLNWYQVKTSGAGLTPEAAHEPAWLNVKTAKIAFLAYYHGDPFGLTDENLVSHAIYSEMILAVADAAARAELVIVSTHWGKAGQTQPVSERQRFFAHGLIDAGADMVLCQRLHTLGGIEIYKGRPIIYSLADFIYDTYDKQHSRVVVPRVTFADRTLKSIELTPIGVDNPDAKYQPYVLSGDEAHEALVAYQQLCAALNTPMTIRDGHGWIQPESEGEEKVPIDPKELF